MKTTRSWGPFREEWYSICSVHSPHKSTCRACQTGQWINVWSSKLSSFVFDHWPRLWTWWANRPNSSEKLYLEEVFPNLKGPTKPS